MKTLNAFRDGMRRAAGAPAVLLGVFALTFLVALPLGLVLAGMIANSLGESEAGALLASGVNYEWWQEFSAQATGVGTAFTPRTIGFGGVLDNASSMLDNTSHPLVVIGAGAAYLLAWIFVAGGILDRYARNRRVRTAAFFATCGVFFFRFLRLGIVALGAYAILFGWVHGWLFGGLYSWATHNLAVERSAFVLRLALYVVFGGLVASVNLLFDYAKVRAVVEDRRSMIGALMAAVPLHPPPAGRHHPAVCARQRALRRAARAVRARRAGRGRLRVVALARPARRAVLPAVAYLGEARVLRVGGRALPGIARACPVHGSSITHLARFARRRSDRAEAGHRAVGSRSRSRAFALLPHAARPFSISTRLISWESSDSTASSRSASAQAAPRCSVSSRRARS